MIDLDLPPERSAGGAARIARSILSEEHGAIDRERVGTARRAVVATTA
jgi:hypothetical protein